MKKVFWGMGLFFSGIVLVAQPLFASGQENVKPCNCKMEEAKPFDCSGMTLSGKMDHDNSIGEKSMTMRQGLDHAVYFGYDKKSAQFHSVTN